MSIESLPSEKQFALVTGASSGIGKALAKELVSRGITVFAGARRVEKMKDLLELGIYVLQLDVTNLDSMNRAFKEIEELSGGKLDYLFNNAGITCAFPVLEVPYETVKDCFETNVFAVIRMNQVFAPLVIRAKGKISVTGSAMGFIPMPFSSVYSATKAAISAYSDALRIEMKAYDVQVTNIVTGTVGTDLIDGFLAEMPASPVINSPEGQNVIQKMNENAHKSKPTAPSVYAERVCNDVVSSKYLKHQYFRGSGATFMSWFTWLIPYSLFEFVIIRSVGFNKLIKSFQEENKPKQS